MQFFLIFSFVSSTCSLSASCLPLLFTVQTMEIKDLTLENFSFFRCELGFGEPFERLRMAAIKRVHLSSIAADNMEHHSSPSAPLAQVSLMSYLLAFGVGCRPSWIKVKTEKGVQWGYQLNDPISERIKQ